MKKLMAVAMILTFVLPLTIVEGEQVEYIGGTVPGIKNETMGTFDTTQEQALVFNHPGGRLVIPYAKVTSFRYEDRASYEPGVILGLLVELLKEPRRQHFLHLSYSDDGGVMQVVTFEVAKERPLTLVPLIESRIKKERPHTEVAQCADR